MQPATLLVLLLVVAVGVGAAWFLLDGSSPADETWDEDPDPDPGPRVPDEPEEPAPPRGPAVVELPAQTALPRVAVLAKGFELPQHGPSDPGAWNAVHESLLKGDPGSLSGEELIQAVAEVIYVRFGTAADLRGIQRLGPDPDWPPDDAIPLLEVIEHWRREGYDVEPRGPFLVVVRRDE